MQAKKEKVLMQNVSIPSILDKEFYKNLKEDFEDLDAITIVFVNKKTAVPLVLSHENQAEIEQKKVHIDCKDEGILDKFIEMLEKMSKKE